MDEEDLQREFFGKNGYSAVSLPSGEKGDIASSYERSFHGLLAKSICHLFQLEEH